MVRAIDLVLGLFFLSALALSLSLRSPSLTDAQRIAATLANQITPCPRKLQINFSWKYYYLSYENFQLQFRAR